MTQIITATEFVTAFRTVVSEPECVQKIDSLWHTSREHSRLFLPPAGEIEESDCFLPRVARRLGLDYWGEFLKIDAAFYSRSGATRLFPVLIEHENNFRESSWEINKLAYVRAPLRVLITYPKEKETKRLLHEYEQVIQLTHAMEESTAYARILVIFGLADNYLPDGGVIWQYFSYGPRGFEEQL